MLFICLFICLCVYLFVCCCCLVFVLTFSFLCRVCSRCIVEFSATRHKFHCGHCGRVLCDTCCSKKRRLPVVGLTLVCVDCLVGIDQAKKAAAGAVNQDVDETNDDDEDDGANAATADDAGDEEAGAAAAAAAAAAAEDAAQAEAEAAEQEAQAEAQQLAAEMAAAAPPPPTIQYPADIGQDVYDVRAHVVRKKETEKEKATLIFLHTSL